jgi:hypothetical protein
MYYNSNFLSTLGHGGPSDRRFAATERATSEIDRPRSTSDAYDGLTVTGAVRMQRRAVNPSVARNADMSSPWRVLAGHRLIAA